MVDHDDIVWVVFACGQTVVIMTPLECYLFHCYWNFVHSRWLIGVQYILVRFAYSRLSIRGIIGGSTSILTNMLTVFQCNTSTLNYWQVSGILTEHSGSNLYFRGRKLSYFSPIFVLCSNIFLSCYWNCDEYRL